MTKSSIIFWKKGKTVAQSGFMRSLIALILVCCGLSACGQSNILSGNISSFNLAGRTNLQLRLSIISPVRRLVNGVFVSSDPVQTCSDLNGNFHFTNVLWGTYRLDAFDSSGSYCNFVVQTNTTGYWQIASLATNSASLLPLKWTFDSTIVTFDQQ
jgi:hypothetical protein